MTGRLDPAAPGSIDQYGNYKARTKLGNFLDNFDSGQMDRTGRQLTGISTFQNYPGSFTFFMRKL